MIDQYYIETDELQQFLAMWQDVQRLVDNQQYDKLVRDYGADFATHLDIGDLPRTIADLETQIAQRS